MKCQEFPDFLPPKDIPYALPSSMVLHSIQCQSPPCSENKHFPLFYSKSSADNIAAPPLLPRGHIQVCVTSGGTPSPYRLSKIHPQIPRLVPGRIPLNYSPVDPFILREHSCLPPGVTGILLKLFCQHPARAGLGFNDIATLLFHSYKDCFDTSRIFDLLVKIKY